MEKEALSAKTRQYLRKRQQEINAASNPKAEVEKCWDSARKTKAFEELQVALRKMTNDEGRCMYCLLVEARTIDHFEPKGQRPSKTFDWRNLLHSCFDCNTQYKGEQFPRDANGKPLLINPTREDPDKHLRLLGRTGKYQFLTSKGEESIKVYGLNEGNRPQDRRSLWFSVQLLLEKYRHARRQGDHAQARNVARRIRRFEVAPVLSAIMRLNQVAPDLLELECQAALRDYGDEIRGWIDLG